MKSSEKAGKSCCRIWRPLKMELKDVLDLRRWKSGRREKIEIEKVELFQVYIGSTILIEVVVRRCGSCSYNMSKLISIDLYALWGENIQSVNKALCTIAYGSHSVRIDKGIVVLQVKLCTTVVHVATKFSVKAKYYIFHHIFSSRKPTLSLTV